MSLLVALLLSTSVAAAPAPDERALVATHYFYWYRWPDAHFDQAGAPGREGHRHPLPHPERADWGSAAWHEEQFRAMAACGIDAALPVYWGAPGAYERPGLRFSVEGLAPMAAALDAIAADGADGADGARGVKLGLFYDTSTLLRSVRGLPVDDEHPERPDLTTDEGKQLFCATVVEYFERVPPRHWARLRGRPLVVTYSAGFAGAWDATLGPALRAAFSARFPGETPFLVADVSWGEMGQELTTAWGAALGGPRLFPSVAQVGPGYDDSPVPGRRTPIRLREDGGFYSWSWRQAVVARPELVLIETWNELHEGTEICETLPTGRLYLDLTREWVARLHANDPGPELPPPAALRPRPDLSWGAEARGAAEVVVDYTGAEPRRRGLRELAWEDGPLEVRAGALRPRRDGEGRVSYLYFQVSDHWRFDQEGEVEVEVTRADRGRLELQYDSASGEPPLDGAYRTASREVGDAQHGVLVERFHLPRARFADRQNGGADFRLVVFDDGAAIRRVRVR